MDKKKVIIMVIIVAILIFALAYSIYSNKNENYAIVEPCIIYKEIGVLKQEINSETEAKDAAINYYQSEGHNISSEQLIAKKIQDTWTVYVNNTNLFEYDKLVTIQFEKNKIIGVYSNPC